MLCDVVLMHAGHILLGRPWQFDKEVIHDGFKNRYSFVKKDNKLVTLVPLTPKQVCKDQLKLKREAVKKKKRVKRKQVKKKRRVKGEKRIKRLGKKKAFMQKIVMLRLHFWQGSP